MSEGEKKKERIPIRVFQQKRPQGGEGYKWEPEYNVEKKDKIVSWRRVSTTGHSDPEGFLVPPEVQEDEGEGQDPTSGFPSPEDLEESRKRKFSSIEDSQPQGDKD